MSDDDRPTNSSLWKIHQDGDTWALSYNGRFYCGNLPSRERAEDFIHDVCGLPRPVREPKPTTESLTAERDALQAQLATITAHKEDFGIKVHEAMIREAGWLKQLGKLPGEDLGAAIEELKAERDQAIAVIRQVQKLHPRQSTRCESVEQEWAHARQLGDAICAVLSFEIKG